MVNSAKILVHLNKKYNKKFCSHFGIDYYNLCFLFLISLLFVSDIDYRQFFAFCVNYRYRFVFAFKQHRLPNLLERKCREILESKLEDGQCGFRPGCSATDQIFTLKQIFEKPWEYGKDLFACFVDLEKAYDRVPRDKRWKVLREYGVDGQLLRAIESFYRQPEVYVQVNGKQTEPFHVGVGLHKGAFCRLSYLLFT